MAISSNNVQNVKFLRNATLYETREAARTALENNKTLGADGTALLARYGSGTDVKTLAGLVWSDGTNYTVTIIDVEGGSSDVKKLREEINAKLGEGITSANTATAQLTALSGTSADGSGVTSVWGAKAYANDLIGTLDGGVTAETGYYVKSVSEVDGKISGTTEALPSVAAISEAGKAITAVSESNGTIAASAGNIDAQYVNIADSGEKFTATTVEGALAELNGKITDAIDALDYTGVTTGTGVYVTNVTEENGKISATTATLPTVDDRAVAKNFVIAVDETLGQISVERGSITSADKTVVLGDAADGGVDFSVHIDNDTLQKDENGVISVTSSALVQYEGDDDTIQISAVSEGVRTVSSPLTIQKVTEGLSAEVKEEYRLVGHSGNTIGDPVKIYKDSHIVSITYITTGEHAQNLEYKYIDASGNTQTTYVDMSELVLEAEFASGVTVTDHVAHGVVDPTSESFLTVGADGFKLAGVQDAINSAINALDATGGTQEIATGKHVAVEVIEKDGLITAVTVTEDDIASATALTKEISDREAGDNALDARLGNGVTSVNTATAQLTALSGTSADGSGVTSVWGAKAYADAKLDDVVGGLNADVSGNSTHVTVGVVEKDGVITAVTVTEDNIAEADDLAKLSGKTITAFTSTNGSISASISNEAGNKTADIQTDASKIKMTGFTATTTGSEFSAITTDSSVADAANEIVKEIISNEAVVAQSLNELDGRLDVIESGYVETVKVNNVALAETNNAVNVQISGANSAMTGTNAVIVDTDSNGAVTIGLGTIDCGTY